MFGLRKKDQARRKRVYWGYSTLDYKGMEAYIEKMSSDGWHLESIGEVWATFREGKPQNLRYSIDVFEQSGTLTPEVTDELKEYRNLCEESGWTFVTSIKHLQIFVSKEEDHLLPLQTDEELEENLAKKKLWRKDFSIGIGVFLLTLGLVIFSRFRAGMYMDDYLGNMIFYVYPFMMISAALGLVRSILWIRKVKKEGLPDKQEETFFSGRRRQLLIDLTAISILLAMILGVILDTIYNPETDMPFALIPVIVGFSIGTILKLTIRKKGEKKEDGLIFAIIAFLMIFIVMAVVNHFESQRFEREIEEQFSWEMRIEEAPEGVSVYPIEEIFLAEEDRELQDRRFPVTGQSFAVPVYYVQSEKWIRGEEEWGIAVRTYETRSERIAQRIVEEYLELRRFHFHFFTDRWVEMEEQKQYWQVDEFYMTEGFPAILIRRGDTLWLIEGDYTDYAREPEKHFEVGDVVDGDELDRHYEELNRHYEEARELSNEEIRSLEMALLLEGILR